MSPDSRALQARVDSLIPEITAGRGQVTATFNTSFDVLIGDYLLNFNLNESALHPLGVLIPEHLLKQSYEGQKLELNQDECQLGGQLFSLEYSCSTPDFKSKKLSVENINCSTLRQALHLADSQSLIKKLLFNKTDNSLTPENEKILRGLKKFSHQLTEGHVSLTNYLDYFGAGPGLTPAWDDFCSGALLADRLAGNERIQVSPNFFDNLQEKTPRTSWWQVKFAASGRLNLGIERLLLKIFTGDATVSNCLELVNFGETSGIDILGGITVYIFCSASAEKNLQLLAE